MFGSHLSIAGSMHLALLEAERLGLDCVQVFTKNQQQWAAPALKAEAVAQWRAELSRLGWDSAAGRPARVTSHASYLINTGSPEPVLRERSTGLLRDEVERCEALDIPLLVFHPGAHISASREEGLERVAGACAAVLRETSGYRTVMCFENVAGTGSHLGRTLEELAWLRSRVIELGGAGERVGFCIDTCHAHAAGYDLSTPAKAVEFVMELERVVGIRHVRCLHVNDSKGACGSRLDRHEHIGAGTIGADGGGGFGVIVGHPALAMVPKIMETPKGQSQAGVDWDTINVGSLRELASGGRLTTRVEPSPSKVGRPKAEGEGEAEAGGKGQRGRNGSPAKAKGKGKSRGKGVEGEGRAKGGASTRAGSGGGGKRPSRRAGAARPRRAKGARRR